MTQKKTVIFVCEHGSAKSIVAATYFNKFAQEEHLQVVALARGTNPDTVLSSYTVAGLLQDGLIPSQLTPQKLKSEELQEAIFVVSFCDLSDADQDKGQIEYWNDVPSVSENYERARDKIISNLRNLMKKLL